jgi:hypothetical protein
VLVCEDVILAVLLLVTLLDIEEVAVIDGEFEADGVTDGVLLGVDVVLFVVLGVRV